MKIKLYPLAKILCFVGVSSVFSSSLKAQLVENFDDILNLPAMGWVLQNNSLPLGTIGWFQGNQDAFPAFNGAANAYIGSNFNSTSGAGTISNWLISPNLTLKNGDVFTFVTRTSADNMWADRLQVRMSTNGASSDVGLTATSVGDFTALLLEINPNLQLSVYPMVWTQYSITISGLNAPTSGRIAFRYFVTNGGTSGTNSDYIGIDNFVHTPYVCPNLNLSPSNLNQAFAGLPFNQSISQTGGLGNTSFSVSAGNLPAGLNLLPNGTLSGTPSATGNFNFTVTATDASGCTGSQTYSMEVQCNPNGASLNNLPTLCSNSNPITLNQGIPSGGAYSGNGVTANQFSPSAGTQVITYTVNDQYGCLQTASSTITVNTAPEVALSPFSNLCFNAPPIVLNGGTPAGGTYSGTSVSGGIFTPNAVGDFLITYTFTDGNNCSGSASQTIRVEVCSSLENIEEQAMILYPNPSTGLFQIDLGNLSNEFDKISVINAQGQIVHSSKINQGSSVSLIQLELNHLPSGVYILECAGSKQKLFSKLILEH